MDTIKQNVAAVCMLLQHPTNQLRIIESSKLEHDMRNFRTISRFVSGDSRFQVLIVLTSTMNALIEYCDIFDDLKHNSQSYVKFKHHFDELYEKSDRFINALDILCKSYSDVNVTVAITVIKDCWNAFISRAAKN